MPLLRTTPLVQLLLLIDTSWPLSPILYCSGHSGYNIIISDFHIFQVLLLMVLTISAMSTADKAGFGGRSSTPSRSYGLPSQSRPVPTQPSGSYGLPSQSRPVLARPNQSLGRSAARRPAESYDSPSAGTTTPIYRPVPPAPATSYDAVTAAPSSPASSYREPQNSYEPQVFN